MQVQQPIQMNHSHRCEPTLSRQYLYISLPSQIPPPKKICGPLGYWAEPQITRLSKAPPNVNNVWVTELRWISDTKAQYGKRSSPLKNDVPATPTA